MCKDSDMITITIDNYKNGKIVYKMPENAIVNLYKATMIAGKNAGKVTNIEISINCKDGIEVIEEGLS